MTRRLWHRWVAHRRAVAARLVARHALLTRRPVPTRLLVALTGDGVGRPDAEHASWPGGRMFVPPLREFEADAPIEDAVRDNAREITAADAQVASEGPAASVSSHDAGPLLTAEAPHSWATVLSASASAPPQHRVARATTPPAAPVEARDSHPPSLVAAQPRGATALGLGDAGRHQETPSASTRSAPARAPSTKELSAPTLDEIDVGAYPEVRPSTLAEPPVGSLLGEPSHVPVGDADRDMPTPSGRDVPEESDGSAHELVDEVGGREQGFAQATPRDPVARTNDAQLPTKDRQGQQLRGDDPAAVSRTVVEPPSEPALPGGASPAPSTAAGGDSRADPAVGDSRLDSSLDMAADIKAGSRPAVAEERRARRPAPLRDGGGAAGSAHEHGRPVPRPGDVPPLFEPRHPNRPASQWLKLLVEATQAPKSGADAAPKPQRRPIAANARRPSSAPPPPASVPFLRDPLLQSTRRFLRPLVGIDPDTVDIYRGPRATAMADAVGADALAIGETVVLPPTYDERTPEGRGLIAHELTHVAQRRVDGMGGPMGAPTEERRSRLLDAEERAARDVEAVVRSAAENDPDRPNARAAQVRDGRTLSDAGSGVPQFTVSAPPRYEGARSELPSELSSVRRPWGTLPAPWEPIPDLEPSAPPARPWPTAPDIGPAPPRSIAPTLVSEARPSAAVADAPSGSEVRLAEADRPVATAEPSAHHAAEAQAPRPDLEQIARRVYDILKRQLAAERRRGA